MRIELQPGQQVVLVAPGAPDVDMLEQLARLVESFDSGDLERRALNRLDLGSEEHAGTAAVLRQIAEDIRGRT